jgi:carboxyl-terminal processing protease
MKLKYKVYLPIIFGLLLAIGMVIGAKLSPYNTTAKYSEVHKIQEVFYHINSSYVDSVNRTQLMDAAITEVLYKLDPHSVYIPAKDLMEMNESLHGGFEGIGVEFNILNDTIIVVSPIAGGPSAELGILAGDKIILIEDENVAGIGISTNDVIKKLKGKKGTKVKVSIFRRNEPELLDFTIVRDKIPIYSVDANYMIDDKIGYIKINRFSGKTADEFNMAINDLKEQGIENLILDLRGNPGGYLNPAAELADEFFGAKKLIVYTKGRSRGKEEYKSSRRGSFIDGNLIILIDEGTASASEIVSGAVQDWDRGIIIGRRSFGKGLVQEQINLSDHSAIRLTVADYYTPSGRCIQKPFSDGHGEYYLDVMRRYEHGELMNKDSIDFPDSLKFTTNGGRTVYGGGGIMPDIFIPMDTTELSDYLTNLNRAGLFFRFVLDYVDKNRESLTNNYPDIDKFQSRFSISTSLMNTFIQYAQDNGVERDFPDIEKSKRIITTQIKGLIGRQLFGSQAYFKIINQIDSEYLKAIEVFQTEKYDNLLKDLEGK